MMSIHYNGSVKSNELSWQFYCKKYYMCTYQCLIDCITISSPSLCVFLLLALLGGEDPVLINCTNLHWDRQEFLVGLASSGGPAASMSWFIQMTSTKNSRNLLSAYLAVLISSPAQPQARGATSSGSEAVMSHTEDSHSTSHCGRQRWRPQLPA